MQLSDIDLLDRDRFTQGVPHEWFTFLRHEAPVYKHPESNGPGFWVITKYDDVVTVGRDGATYSSHARRGGVVVLEGRPEAHSQFEGGGNLMLTMDAPEHTRYRKLVNRGFTPRQMRLLEPHIRELTAQIIDQEQQMFSISRNRTLTNLLALMQDLFRRVKNRNERTNCYQS